MSIFKEFANDLEKINPDKILQRIMNYEFTKEFVINIVQERLDKTGIDALGKKIHTDLANHQKFGGRYGAYAATTEAIKRTGIGYNGKPVKKRPFKHVTFSQTGKFYNTWKVFARKAWLNISAVFGKYSYNIYTKKTEYHNLKENFTTMYPNDKSFETAILGMNKVEFELFVEKIILPEFLGIINYEITH